MSFQNPNILFALIVALVPLALHIYSRWFTDDFNRRAVQLLNVSRATRWKRLLEPWLVVAGWTLVLAMIAVALAGPVVRTPLFASREPPRSRTTIVLLDCSESMNRKDTLGMDAAKAWAANFFNDMQPDDKVAVFAVREGELVPLLAPPSESSTFARSSIVLLPKLRGAADWPIALDAATRILACTPSECDILVLSDDCRRVEEQVARKGHSAVVDQELPQVWIADLSGSPSPVKERSHLAIVSSVDELRERRGRGPASRGVGGLVLLAALALVGLQLAYIRWSRRSTRP